jgi:hypothetical protein
MIAADILVRRVAVNTRVRGIIAALISFASLVPAAWS